MYSLENIDRISYPVDLVMDLTKLYRFKGKDFYYEDMYKNDMQTIIKDTIERDTIYAAKILNLNISESRVNLVVKKGSNPKTNDEIILANLKEVFTIIQNKGTFLELTSNEFLRLAERIFGEVKNISYSSKIIDTKYNLLNEKKTVSSRKEFETLISIYKKHLSSGDVEPTQLATNLFVDIYNLKLYNIENDFMCLLVYYCLLFKERFNVFKYVSFFQMYVKNMEEFKSAIISTSFNWSSGFAQTSILNRLTIKLMLSAYEQIEAKTNEEAFINKRINKITIVETSILKLGEIFTKDQIREANPYFSDSTINRALESLKSKNKIRPNGTGRSATWINLSTDEIFTDRNKQMSLFDLAFEDEDE